MVSGWLSIPLNEEGRINARHAAHLLKSKGITSITSSDTIRCAQTAKIVSRELGIPVVETKRLRSWNMGSLQGMEHTTAKPFLTFFEKNPDVRVPDGEAFRTFYNRFKNVFYYFVGYAKKFPNAVPLICTHSQDLDLIPWFLKGVEPGKELEFGNGIKPGGLLEVRISNEGELSCRKLKV